MVEVQHRVVSFLRIYVHIVSKGTLKKVPSLHLDKNLSWRHLN